MAASGQRIRVATGVGPTGILSEPSILGRVIAVEDGAITVLWENGVVSSEIPDGTGNVEIIGDPSQELVDQFFCRLVRYKNDLQRGCPNLSGYVAGIYTVTSDEPDAPTVDKILIKTIGQTYAELRAEDVEELPGQRDHQ